MGPVHLIFPSDRHCYPQADSHLRFKSDHNLNWQASSYLEARESRLFTDKRTLRRKGRDGINDLYTKMRRARNPSVIIFDRALTLNWFDLKALVDLTYCLTSHLGRHSGGLEALASQDTSQTGKPPATPKSADEWHKQLQEIASWRASIHGTIKEFMEKVIENFLRHDAKVDAKYLSQLDEEHGYGESHPECLSAFGTQTRILELRQEAEEEMKMEPMASGVSIIIAAD